MKIRFVMLAAVLAVMAAVLCGCGGSGGWWEEDRYDNRYEGEYVYTSQDYNYKEYLYVERNGQFGIGYYERANDGYYYRYAVLEGVVYNNGQYNGAVKKYDDGYRVANIYGNFNMKYRDELWVKMTETNPYSNRTVTSNTQYFRENWRNAKTAAGDEKLPEKIKADDNGKTGEKTEE